MTNLVKLLLLIDIEEHLYLTKVIDIQNFDL